MPTWTDPTPAQARNAPPPEPAPEPAPPKAFDGLARALVELLRTAESVRLYSEDHPAVRAGREAASEAFTQALAIKSPMTAAVHHDTLRLDDKPLPKAGRLAEALYRAEIAAVRFGGSMSPETCQTLAAALGPALTGTAGPSELVAAVAEASGGAVTLRPIDYRALGAGAGGADRDSGEGGLDVAERLASAIATAACGSIADAAHMAAGLESRFEEIGHEEAQRIREAAAQASGSDGADSLRAFFAALSPEARARVLDFGTASDSGELEQLADVSLLMPVADVVAAIESIDATRAGASPATVKLFRRLATIAPGAGDQSERIARLAERWKTSAHGSETLESLTELLTTLNDQSFNPTDYEQRLEELVSADKTFADLAKGTDIEDDTATKIRAMEIAAQVLGTDLPDTIERHNPLNGLEASVPLLIEEGRLDLLAEAVTQARRIALHPVSDQELEAAQTLVRALGAPDVLRLAARRFAAGGGQATHAERLLRAAGEDSLDALIAAAEHVTGASRRLVQLAREIDAKGFERRLGAVAAVEPGRFVALRSLLEDFTPQKILAMLEPARRARDPHYRVQAHRALSATIAKWPPPVLFDALADPIDAVKRCAIEHLANRHDRNAAEMLSRLVGGSLPGPRPTPDIVELAIAVLSTMKQDIAVPALADALAATRRGVFQATGPVAHRLVQALGAYTDDPAAQAAVRAWSRSPARLAGFLFGRGSGERHAKGGAA